MRATRYDRLRYDLTDPDTFNRTMPGGWVKGRVEIGHRLTLMGGPMSVALTGSVGDELNFQGLGPAVIDLSAVKAPVVRILTNEDVLVRVGPGIAAMEIAPRRGVILARGAPKLRVQFRPDPNKSVAVVGY